MQKTKSTRHTPGGFFYAWYNYYMFNITLGIVTRIFSNTYLNIYQKILTNNNEKPSVINFYTYLGLVLIGIIVCPNPIFNIEILRNFLAMGVLGALGNYFIIKALSCGELSSVAPINSYKPVVALFLGIFLLKEIPDIQAICGILLIVFGTFVLASTKFLLSKAFVFRILALVFSASEAIFIKKIILLSDIQSCFLYWTVSGLIFALIFALLSHHKLIIKRENWHSQLFLIILVAIMQYSTNYVFSKMNIAYALALFQLSTILSVIAGAKVFREGQFIRKIIGAIIMAIGAVCIILA